MIAADILVQLHDPLSPGEERALDPLLRNGARHTTVIGTYGLASSHNVPDATLVLVGVVDPQLYPFYGKVVLTPQQSLQSALRPDEVAISPELLSTLRVHQGDRIQLAGSTFAVRAIVESRPDWEIGTSTLLPQVLLSYEAYERSGIARQGVEADYRVLIKLGRNTLQESLAQLTAAFPTADIFDYRDPRPGAARAFDAAGSFFGVAALLALGAGTLVLSLILYLHLEQRLDAAAVMKALGAARHQVVAVYLAEICALGLAGGIVSVLAAPLAAKSLAALANRYLPMGLDPSWSPIYALEGVALGLLSALLAAVGPLMRLRAIRPSAILRRRQVGQSASRVAGMGPPVARLAIRNLFRSDGHSRAVFAALTVSAALMSTTWITERRIAGKMQETIPASSAQLYLIGASPSQVDEAAQWLTTQSGVTVRSFPLVWLRLVRTNGAPAGPLAGEWLATCSSEQAPGTVSISSEEVQARPGDLLEFHTRGRTVQARVAPGARSFMEESISVLRFHCSSFKSIATFHHAAITVQPGEEKKTRRSLAGRFPRLPTLSRDQLRGSLQRIAGHAAAMTRLIVWQVFAIALGLQVLLVASAKRARLFEVAVLKSLGAGPSFLTMLFALEYGMVGLMAGCAGGIAGTLLASVVVTVLLRQPSFLFDAAVAAAVAVLMSVVVGLVGGVAGWQVLQQRPLSVLRED